MKQTNQTLLEQMRITELDIADRKVLLSLTQKDCDLLKECKNFIETKIDSLVAVFYEMQTNIPEISLLIGDADTLARLQSAQRRYVLDLFSGLYDLEYVNNRLRIGLVHKRIGVEPKLYLSAISTLKGLLVNSLRESIEDVDLCAEVLSALDKLISFDVTLVFETYIRSLVSEIESSKEKSEQYASALEEKVKERTAQLEELSRIDSLTGLLNVRGLSETVTRVLRASQRRSEPVSLVYIDINDFKLVNDTQGHHFGDDILRVVGASIKKVSRAEDACFRYGGDEFCIILPNCSREKAGEIYADRLREEIKSKMENVTISVGIIQAGPDEYPEAEAFLHEADQKMYLDKKTFKAKKKA
ncbi:MAG TPA: GGDEF domain-containing protein [Sulfuricurvum sp.]|nr:GGDEF domain-containing protein [Sulfuricurvum sp.]